MPMHNHDAVQVLIPLENAHFEITWKLETKESESKSLSTADSCLIPPRLEHEVRWSHYANFVNIYITPNHIQQHVDASFDSQERIFEAVMGMDDRFVFYLGQSIKNYLLKHPQKNNYKYLNSILTVVAQHLLDNFLVDEGEANSAEPVLFNDYSQLPCEKIRDAIRFMTNNLDRNLAVTEIADAVNMSHYHFIRVFRQMVGMSPATFHRLQRIEKAKDLLARHRQIMEVACELGFSSQAHFSNVFAKSVGVTPRKFMLRGARH